jgi:hypothetical protein
MYWSFGIFIDMLSVIMLYVAMGSVAAYFHLLKNLFGI